MKFIFLDKPIQDQKMLISLKTKNYSEILFKKHTLLERIENSLDDRFEFSFSNSEDELINEDECVIWTSDIVYKDLRKQRLFLNKLFFSYGPYLWGNENSFIFKGNYSELINYSNQSGNLEDFLLHINNFETFQSLLDENLDTRFFNQINKISEKYSLKIKYYMNSHLLSFFLKKIFMNASNCMFVTCSLIKSQGQSLNRCASSI